MITTMTTTIYTAAKTAYVPTLPKPFSTFPVLSCYHMQVNEDTLTLTMATIEDDKLMPVQGQCRARIEGEAFTACVPARPFRDWLKATMPAMEYKHDGRRIKAKDSQLLTLS